MINAEMLSTPWRSTLSAAAKALARVIFSWLMSFSRSLGITIRLSTCISRLSMPCSAMFILRLPSNEKGLVTMPTVRMPRSWATSATTGAAPVPVPPPIPAVINTICAPFRALAISSLLSSAARWPTSGSAPAPRPLVSFAPSCTFWVALLASSACWSVFMATNSTPCTPSSSMRFTALPPPPPTPITLMLVTFAISVSSIKAIVQTSPDLLSSRDTALIVSLHAAVLPARIKKGSLPTDTAAFLKLLLFLIRVTDFPVKFKG